VHTELGPHEFPHAPQLSESVDKFAQRGPPPASPPPPSPVEPSPLEPSPPLLESDALSWAASTPASPPNPLPHGEYPGAHESAHFEALQSCPAVHFVPHVPQLFGSVSTFTHNPLHDICPVGHATVHLPATHASPDPQPFPHTPQLPRSVCVSMHAPPHAVWPALHVSGPVSSGPPSPMGTPPFLSDAPPHADRSVPKATRTQRSGRNRDLRSDSAKISSRAAAATVEFARKLDHMRSHLVLARAG
jgi:hypothetical protein